MIRAVLIALLLAACAQEQPPSMYEHHLIHEFCGTNQLEYEERLAGAELVHRYRVDCEVERHRAKERR